MFTNVRRENQCWFGIKNFVYQSGLGGYIGNIKSHIWTLDIGFVGLAYQGKDIVFRFIIEYSSLRDFGRCVFI